jgi:Tol biopolymer transport system component
MSNRPTKTSRPTAVAHIAVAVLTLLCGASLVAPGPTAFAAEVAKLAAEVKAKGWIAYGARAANGDWDLFLCRPDGTGVHPLTRTPELNEFSPQFSRDGRRLLYRRIPRDEVIDNNHHGEQGELVLARSDGQDAIVFGKPGEYPWASWNADATQIACLSIKGITLVDVAGRKVVRTLPRRGFFQQLVWSPNGQWLVGVANSYGASWSIARMAVVGGEAGAVNRVDCCTPDWFPDSKQIVFSWRPPGQEVNRGYGWTQLWMADAEGKNRQLVYAEEGRHVYGGHVSPDGRYVLFTGNMREDGDPGNAGAPMGLMRLSDSPMIRGESREFRRLQRESKSGPMLVLPAGWEPCWTFSENPGVPAADPAARSDPADATDLAADTTNLAGELHDRGWIVFSARTDRGDWDLFRMRPDGSDRRKVTDTPEFNEVGARFSPDGTELLYYRMPKSEAVDNNTYGTYELLLSKADGSDPVVYGNTFHWASWGPEGRRIACLAPSGIQIIDVASREVVGQHPRKGIVSQLVWSPDGKRFLGTANGLGPYWNIGCLDPNSSEIHAVSETQRYNCTPDWTPGSQQAVYARGIIPEKGGRAELWVARTDGTERRTLYAEAGRHIYGACVSPDGKYLLFTRSIADLGKVEHEGTTMSIIRWADAPVVGDSSKTLRARLPDSRSGPRLDLGRGWEPHWTAEEIGK